METSKPRATQGRRGTCAQKVWGEGAAGVPGAEAVARNTALRAALSNGRRCVDARHRRAGQRVWPLRLPADHGAVASPGLASGQGSRAADLAARGAGSDANTKGASPRMT